MPRDDAQNRSASRARRGIGLYATGLLLAAAGAILAVRSTPAPPQRPASTGPIAPPSAARGEAWFEEVASASGVDFHHVSGAAEKWHMPEIMSGGVCVLDFDGDDRLDVYYVQGGRLVGADESTPTSRLYRNVGGGNFVDATPGSGLDTRGYGMGCATGDFDNDGRVDLFVTQVGPDVLYRNNGGGTFSDVTADAGVGDPGFGSSAAFFDADNDGDLDLYVCNYVLWSPETEPECTIASGQRDYCTPIAFRGRAFDTLFRNEGNGEFTDVSESAGIRSMTGNGLGVVPTDVNLDGRMDLIVANDLTPNQLWMNQGGGVFRDEALERGAAYSGEGMAQAGMGIDARDVDEDGDFDFFVTHFAQETNTLYLNQGEYFIDATSPRGLNSSRPFTGWGTAMLDFNNDGRRDIYVANGRVTRSGQTVFFGDDPYAEPSQLWEQRADGAFEEIMPRGGTTQPLAYSSRGAAFADYDDDGDIDVFIANRDGPALLLRNVAATGRNWIQFRALNAHGSDALGAMVTIETQNRKRIDEVRTAYSYLAASDPRVHFGLGSIERVDAVTVRWPDGTIANFGPFVANHVYELRRDGTSQLKR